MSRDGIEPHGYNTRLNSRRNLYPEVVISGPGDPESLYENITKRRASSDPHIRERAHSDTSVEEYTRSRIRSQIYEVPTDQNGPIEIPDTKDLREQSRDLRKSWIQRQREKTEIEKMSSLSIGIRPPRFDSQKSDIRKFLSRYDKYLLQFQSWDDEKAINYLSNLLDDESLQFFDSLCIDDSTTLSEVKEMLLSHYEASSSNPNRWSKLVRRRQKPGEKVTEFYDDLLRLSEGLQISSGQMCLIFMDGLPRKTREHIALVPEQPTTMPEAFKLAKNYQAIFDDDVESRENPPKTAAGQSELAEVKASLRLVSEQLE